MITSVFRYQGGEPAPVDEAVIAPETSEVRRSQIVTTLARETLAASAADASSFLWIKIADPTPEDLSLVKDLFDLPSLQVDDAANPRQRAKLEIQETGGRAFVALKELSYRPDETAVETGQVCVFIGPGYAVSIRHGNAAPGSARERLAAQPELTRWGPVSVLYAIVDVLVDGYLDIVEALQSEIEDVEQAVFSTVREDEVGLIYNLKRENLEVKRAVSPMVGTARMVALENHPFLRREMVPYFRDVGDHVLRVNDLVESYDQLLMTMLMASISQQDLRQNRDMRKISAWAAIIAVPTAMAGVYGMNFDDMPELHWTFGYPAVLLVMLGVCLFLHHRFKKSGWL